MNLLTNTGVPIKSAGDSISHEEFNSINNSVNSTIDALNYLLKSFCNINAEDMDFEQSYTLLEAIAKVPTDRRQSGMKIRFRGISGQFLEYIYEPVDISISNWENPLNWATVITATSVDGGEW